ncbi:MAG: DUF6036 family nucleotidyltransferase [Thermoanaerobaculia bacterium]
MRRLVDRANLDALLRELGRHAEAPTRLFLVGGSSALLHGWRSSTIDVDIRIEPDSGAVARAIPQVKERLAMSIELASPLDFLPPLPGWRDRCRFLRQEGKLAIFEFDFYSQALAKIERGFETDLADVRSMIGEGLVEPKQLQSLFSEIAGEFFRFPAVDVRALAADLARAMASTESRDP